jgi:hypothetical protein
LNKPQFHQTNQPLIIIPSDQPTNHQPQFHQVRHHSIRSANHYSIKPSDQPQSHQNSQPLLPQTIRPTTVPSDQPTANHNSIKPDTIPSDQPTTTPSNHQTNHSSIRIANHIPSTNCLPQVPACLECPPRVPASGASSACLECLPRVPASGASSACLGCLPQVPQVPASGALLPQLPASGAYLESLPQLPITIPSNQSSFHQISHCSITPATAPSHQPLLHHISHCSIIPATAPSYQPLLHHTSHTHTHTHTHTHPHTPTEMAIDDGIKRMAQELGGQRALDKVEALCRELKEYHNQHGSEVKENEKGRWGGALYAWIRKGRPVAVHGQPTPTEEEQVVFTMVIVEQYNTSILDSPYTNSSFRVQY